MPELDNAKNALIDLGWSEYESRTYSALVQLGRATASKIAKNSNVPPNRVYQILNKLSERGVVHTTTARGSTTEYEATDPSQVLEREKQEFSKKVDDALVALDELKERKQDTGDPITYTIYGKQELSTYLQVAIKRAKTSVFIALDTLIELRHREILDILNQQSDQLKIDILTTQRGVNDEYEKEVADELEKSIGLKISKDEFAVIFMVVDEEIMIYTAYGFQDEERGDRDYYGIYTNDPKTTKLLVKSFYHAFELSEFYREEDIKAEKERKKKEKKKDSNKDSDDEKVAPKGPKASSGPSLG